MLCPDCKTATPGGSLCPGCGHTVPERETFAGQGGRYLAVLAGVSATLLAVSLLARALGAGGPVLARLYARGWQWLYATFVATPIIVGLYYWFVLREEEIAVTDEAISRRSHWGDEHLRWADVHAYRRLSLPLRQTRLGRLTWFSRFFPRGRPDSAHGRLSGWPGATYELAGPPDAQGHSLIMRLEPGTIDDMAWLLELVQEHLGPPQEG